MNKLMIVVLTLTIILLVGCGGETITGNVVNEPIKIGVMTMTTGDVAFLGQNIVKSAELAVEELEYDNVELIIADVGNLGEGRNTVAAYRKLVDVDKVEIIIDGMLSDGTMAVAPLLDQDEVVMITPLTGGENIDNAAEYLFRNGPSDIIAGTKPAKQLLEFGFENVALYTDNAEYTLDIRKHFVSSFRGKIVVDEVIIPDKSDYRGELSKITNEVDAIVINTATGMSAPHMIKQLYELGNEKPIFVNFLAFNDNALEIAGNALENVYVYDPEFDETSSLTTMFFSQYEKKYGVKSNIPFHATGTYDAIRMSVEAVEKVGYDGKKVHDYLLENVQGWQGMNGVVTFDEKGNTQTGFVLKQVRNGELVMAE
ncbi:ABC transporter substrate-binding protein [Candidatus Woesearchaeota archaeon]|nr:ABC transporter substrate-binding protein [Candidatus Woesearchaeota archaeon]MBT3537876.1 ABC transporter substrate-binding protein [Candidatus Woesearchaeota archaeon]MBT4698007.1 ABC transporter substrate-binding protein [Candidatus Woesearchaeota archaeon]MBT4716596.1 ABC transporter substrate-binding protein [Candidatus Woesearchaeota archaeon]MBT7105545.1 ABC transporter substrate-binding protein [Candidatus Woesearchaeota archaeon]